MRIALFGYGKMGKAIERIAVSRGHTVVLRVDSKNAGALPADADVAIEFSRPDQAVANMRSCLERGVPVVVGTTGWYDHLNDVQAMVKHTAGALLWASNFSIGVNLFFKVNRLLAGLMDKQADYQVHIDEVHHVHKLDAPSGTAITLARDIDLRTHRYSGHELRIPRPVNEVPILATDQSPVPVPILSERIGEVTGKHAVSWTGPNDRIIITHEAFDRSGFAQGAVVAAEWIRGRKGMFTMDDVLDAS